MNTPRGSIVIPAFNEEAVIARTLNALADGLDFDAVDVVVACNGCTDATADVVRSLGLAVRVLELGPVGKAGAIRSAEATVQALPRLYIDADVTVSGTAAMAVLAALGNGATAARPPIEFDVVDASWIVRRFAACRMRLPSVMGDLCGAGVYGLSAEARQRFGIFPDVTADDLFVARIVEANEIAIVDCAPVRVRLPLTGRSLVRTLARVYRGNAEFASTLPGAVRTTTGGTGRELLHQASDPRRVVDVAVYVVAVVCGRLRAQFTAKRPTSGWERDDSSRIAKVGAL